MKPSEQGFFQASWVQIVVCYASKYLSNINDVQNKSFFWAGMLVVFYDQNLQKHKYLSRISMFLHIEQGSAMWVQIWSLKNINISATRLQNRAFSELVEMKPNESK